MKSVHSTKAEDSATFNKRPGTSGIRGQLYETKLISLIYYRAIHDDNIEDFYLATNIDKIGTFDDICFRAKVKGFDRPMSVFIQAKHRENDKKVLNNRNDLTEYFDSYLKIRREFKQNNKNVLFEGTFDEIECLFVMYTTTNDEFSNDLIESRFANHLNDLIGTDGTTKQPYKNEEDVKFLCSISMKEQITNLAEKMTIIIRHKANLETVLNNELMLRFHVILARKVINVSEVKPEGYRVASFREDFFDTNEEYLILLKETLYMEILKNRQSKENDADLLSEFFIRPTEIKILSKLIGSVINYKNGQFEFVKKWVTDTLKRQLNQVYVPQSTINKAIELAAKEMLISRTFKVPAAFGNKDLTIKGADGKIEKRLNHLTSKMFEWFANPKPDYVYTIDESLGNAFLQLTGGMAGAVGNLLVCDESTGLYKFTDDCESLGNLAKRLFHKLKLKIPNLNKYKFDVKVKKFPILSFKTCYYEECLARDFLYKLIFYTNQAKEDGVEEILKSEIEMDQRYNGNNIRVRSDAIFLKYHDEIQKWWMVPKEASYLTKKCHIYQNSVINIVKDPLMSVINMMFMNKIKNIDNKFNEDLVRSLNIPEQFSTTVIISESTVLTVAKFIQYLGNNNYVVLDIEHILNLYITESAALFAELTSTCFNKETTIIVLCDEVQNSRNWRKTMEVIAKAARNRKTIVVINQSSLVTIKKYFTGNIINDKRNELSDMSKKSQELILKTAKVIFQGKEVNLGLIIDDESKIIVEGAVLNRIISKETIVVGRAISNSNYNEIKHLYVDRRIKKPNCNYDKIINTLNDITDDVVVITAKPGMGKSTLLTHLSLQTKEIDPKVWIVRINLLEYSKEFSTWKEAKTVIDLLEALIFICHIILSEEHTNRSKVTITLEESNGFVNLKDCTGDQQTVFELKMFLHFYNRGHLIFLFDGFDEICPQYANEVMKCLKVVSNCPRKHKMWIASRSYNEIESILKQEFGISYEIQHFSYNAKEKYLKTFWKYNLIMNELDSAQLNNVYEFLKFMSKSQDYWLFKFASPLHEMYSNAADYLVNEIKYSHIPLWTYSKEENSDFLMEAHSFMHRDYDNDENSDVGIPLHLYLMADYFQNEIKDVNNKSNKWNVDINTFTIYERFIETKLKKIRFQEKNKMDIYNPDVMITYTKELVDFIDKHKKLAAYAIFYKHKHKLFNSKELDDIKDKINLIQNGVEKTGVIYSVSNNIPIFVHMTFAEYFAVEYVCDLLKNESCSEKQKSITDIILKVTFALPNTSEVRAILDSKIRIDKELVNVLQDHKKVIFDFIIEQGRLVSVYYVNQCSSLTEFIERTNERLTRGDRLLIDATAEELPNIILLFLSILDSCSNKDNLDDLIEIVNNIYIVTIIILNEFYEFFFFALDVVRKNDESKLRVFCDDVNVCSIPQLRYHDGMNNLEIVHHLQQRYTNYWAGKK